MIPVQDLRAGTTFQEGKEIFQVLSYAHIKMGRGSANIKVKVKNLRSGATTEKSFINNAQVLPANLERREHQFLYKDSSVANFMDPQTYEQHSIPLKNLEGHEYLVEGNTSVVFFFEGVALSLFLPPKITLTVVNTPPGVKGNSASNVYKDAILENGKKVRVPLFINIGDKVVIDTRDGTYTKRV